MVILPRKLGGFRETEHFEIFYARELETEIEQIAEDCEFQYAQLSAYLMPDGDELSQKVRAYIYASPEQKKRLIGARGTSVEDPFGYGFHIHKQGFPHPVLKHELAHVFTVPWSPLKVSLKIGLHEGIAVAADWDEGRLTAHQWQKRCARWRSHRHCQRSWESGFGDMRVRGVICWRVPLCVFLLIPTV